LNLELFIFYSPLSFRGKVRRLPSIFDFQNQGSKLCAVARVCHSRRASIRFDEKAKLNWEVIMLVKITMVIGLILGTASGALAAPKHKHHATAHAKATYAKVVHAPNSAYDVYNTRGWYIGSDPDATIRFMFAMDPAAND
jgi:hypothetical protein